MCLTALEASRIRSSSTCLGSEKSDFVDSDRPQSLQQIEPILETLNDGVVIADDSDQTLLANAVSEEMIGIPRSEIIMLIRRSS
jgi:PAS domain-containing protein